MRKAATLALLLTACAPAPPETHVAGTADASPPQCVEPCKLEGRCTLDGGNNCIAANNKDCRKSKACWLEMRCNAVRGKCVSTWVVHALLCARGVL